MASSRRGLLDEARAGLARAGEARRCGDHRVGADAAGQALELARRLSSRRIQASALRLLALHRWRLGEGEAAIDACLQALPMLRGKREAGERSDVLCTLVMAYNSLGLHADALEYVTELLDAARASGDPSLLSWALNRVGVTYEALANRREAEHFLLQALDIARQIKGDEEMFSALNNLCSTLVGLAVEARGGVIPAPTAEEMQRALAYGNEALALARTSGNTHREAVSHGNLATVHIELDNLETALMHIERETELAIAHGYRALIHTSVVDRAELHRRRGELPEAIVLYEAALAEALRCDDPGAMLEVHSHLYRTRKSMGDFAAALEHHEAMLLFERDNMRRVAATQARLLINRLELEHARVEAQRAHLDAQVQRLRAMQLENEKLQLEQRASELGRHAFEDQLTGLANRRRIDHELPLQLAAAHERSLPLSIAILDLDHFKDVNDRFGHGVGDDALRAVAAILLDNIRSSDVLARMGGEEFIVVFVGTALSVATEVCERLRRAVEAHGWQHVAQGLHLTISIGVCDAARSADMRGLVECADAALYQAKRGGRNRVQVAGAGDYIDASSIAR